MRIIPDALSGKLRTGSPVPSKLNGFTDTDLLRTNWLTSYCTHPFVPTK